MSYRIFELPLALCPNGTPAIQLLCQRDRVQTAVGQLWLGKNFALSGSPPDSYALLQSFSRFAWHGKLVNNYTDQTLCIDTRIGMLIQLDGPDLVLDEVTDFDAVAGAYWVVVDDEILFLAEPMLKAAGLYQISTVRGQFGSPIQAHTAGTDVFIIRAGDYAPLSFPTLLPGNVGQFKVTLGVQNLSDQAASAPGYVGSAFAVSGPGAITVNGIAINPIVPVMTNFTVAWQAPAINGALPSNATLSTLVEIITPSATFSVKVAAPVATYNVVWADLPADANCGFTVQLTTQVDTGQEIISGAAEEVFVGVSGPGLVGRYYNDPSGSGGTALYTTLALTRVDANVDFDWGGGSPGAPVNSTDFSVKWTGCIVAPATGAYTFTLNSDDGSRLWIGGVIVADTLAASGTVNGNINLTAGVRYAIVVEYWQGPPVSDFVHLTWLTPGSGSAVAVPSTNLLTA